MANKIVLTQIMKNEEHVVERQLKTLKPICDMICFVDTGSTDKTIELVKKWGIDNDIETHVLERPFDNFEDSRNASIEYALEMTQKYKNDTWYGMWLDCDEELQIDEKVFDKQKLDKQLYMISTTIGLMSYTRNELYRLDGGFTFYGPVHEFIIPPKDKAGKAKQVTSGIAEGLHVQVHTDGGSWLAEGTEKKYRNHAQILEEYINYKDRDPRWIFYTAQSYHDSATIPNNREENIERLRRAMKYYTERALITGGYHEERYYSQFRVGTIKKSLEYPWQETMSECLKAYNMDPLRGESIKTIIDHYQGTGNWNLAYLYTKFAYETFHAKNPYPQRLLFIDSTLYNYKFLEMHASSAFYTQRKDESSKVFGELLKLIETNPEHFTEADKARIQGNAKHFITPPVATPVK
jgi:glycosyltransferase involved in cell wall biosynthesis